MNTENLANSSDWYFNSYALDKAIKTTTPEHFHNYCIERLYGEIYIGFYAPNFL
jgi:hypothetical protein